MSIIACSVDECEKPVHVKKRQLCRSHYNRFMSYGDLNVEVPPVACRRCGGPIARERKPSGPSPKYCTAECHNLAGRERYVESDAYESDKAAKREANRIKPLNSLECIGCGGNFESRDKVSKFCSQRCCNRWLDTHNKARCTASDCDRGVRAKGICSMHWKRKEAAEGRRSKEPWGERRKANYHKRRAQKLNLPADAIRPLDVYERDEWVCGLCSLPVDRAVSYPDPLSPSLDHVIPLSLGGHHVMENVQLAHLSCNVRKGNRVEVDAMSV